MVNGHLARLLKAIDLAFKAAEQIYKLQKETLKGKYVEASTF
jgi:hypothetical protein